MLSESIGAQISDRLPTIRSIQEIADLDGEHQIISPRFFPLQNKSSVQVQIEIEKSRPAAVVTRNNRRFRAFDAVDLTIACGQTEFLASQGELSIGWAIVKDRIAIWVNSGRNVKWPSGRGRYVRADSHFPGHLNRAVKSEIMPDILERRAAIQVQIVTVGREAAHPVDVIVCIPEPVIAADRKSF